MRLLHEIAIFKTVKSKVIISLFETVRLSVSISLRNLYNSLNSMKEKLLKNFNVNVDADANAKAEAMGSALALLENHLNLSQIQ